ncbi:MAG: Bax inhibitor-1/YccA family protein [Chromatiales bacterium]|nr:Bax inhibitor-1/YccA family protein [Chromatiales bacterium]
MNQTAVSTISASALSTNKLIRNTYMLLSMTLLFSALTATASVAFNMPPITYLLSLGGAMLLIWMVLPRTANSSAGLGVVFAITGLMGFGLGPILTQYLALPNGGQLIATAFGGTGIIFLSLSTYALTTRKDFSFMGGFLMTGMMVILIAALANIFLAMPLISLVISSVVIMLMSGFILYDTSRMVNGTESNYIHMTVSLYLSLFNIFISLLQILGAFAGNRD